MFEDWHDKHYAFFQNTQCECFPCHKTEDLENFNCLFCYCPLYLTGTKCGGNYKILKNGIKDCSGCCIPHRRENYQYIVDRFTELGKEMRLNEDKIHTSELESSES